MGVAVDGIIEVWKRASGTENLPHSQLVHMKMKEQFRVATSPFVSQSGDHLAKCMSEESML